MKNKDVQTNIIFFTSGELISLLGSTIFSFVMSLYVLKITGSSISFSLSFAIGTLPRLLFGTIAGTLADKINKKIILTSSGILSFLVLLILFLYSSSELSITSIYLSTFLLSTISTFFNTALMSSIPSLVDDSAITKINSISQSVISLASITSPFIGAILYEITDIRHFIVINAIIFLISGITQLFIKFNHSVELNKNEENNSFKKELTLGVEYVIKTKWLSNLLVFVLFFNSLLVISLEISLPYLTRQILNFTTVQVGTLNAIYPLAIFATSMIITIMKKSKINYKKILISIFIMGGSMSLIGLLSLFDLGNSNLLVCFSIFVFLIGTSETLVNIPVLVTIQTSVPNEMLGRVQGILTTFVLGLVPLSSLIGGYLLTKYTSGNIIMVSGILMFLMTILMSKNKEIKVI